MGTVKKHSKESIHQLIMRNDKALIRGLMVIYALQTADEKVSQDTRNHNGVGFSPFHAKFLTSVAQFYERTGRLSQGQLVYVRKYMRHYAGQLAKIANGEISNPLAPVQNHPQETVAHYEARVEREAIQAEPILAKQLVW